jgi:hypothetical protein
MDLKDYSITRLAHILDLSRKRIIKLLEEGKIYINQYNEICIKAY